MHVRVEEMARAHDGLVTWSGLRAAGLTEDQALIAVADLRRVHDGVFLTGQGRMTDHQRRLAATLTASRTALSGASGGALHGFRPVRRAAFEVITRPGTGGPRRIGALLVCRSSTLCGEVIVRDGIPVTSPTRTLIDLCSRLNERERAKAVREGIRLGVFTALEVRLAAVRYRGRRGTSGLAEQAQLTERLPLTRTRSDAEARALEVLAAARMALPRVNVRCAGEEADLSWTGSRRILEIDGPQFHQDQVEDQRKEAAWRSAGWTVERIPSNVVFDAPEKLIALVSRWANVQAPGLGAR